MWGVWSSAESRWTRERGNSSSHISAENSLLSVSVGHHRKKGESGIIPTDGLKNLAGGKGRVEETDGQRDLGPGSLGKTFFH